MAKQKTFTTSAVARQFRLAGSDAVSVLKKAGIKPLAEITINNRTYREWGMDAFEALRAWREAIDNPPTPAPTAAPTAAPTPDGGPDQLVSLRTMVTDLGRCVSAIASQQQIERDALSAVLNRVDKVLVQLGDLASTMTQVVETVTRPPTPPLPPINAHEMPLDD